MSNRRIAVGAMKRLIIIVALIVMISGCVSSTVEPLPPPPKVKDLPTTSSVPDFSGTSIPRAVGTSVTTQVKLTPGGAALSGRVLDATGAPVPSANIRIERFVDNQSAGVDLLSTQEGAYSLKNLIGGLYRLRAYKPPSSTMATGQLVFLSANESRTVDLSLAEYSGGMAVNAALAPDPPILGGQVNLVVAVTTRGVDSSGVARSLPEAGLEVVLSSGAGKSIDSFNPQTTDSTGTARWTLTCTSLDDQELAVTLPDGSETQLNLAPCRLPPPTTTTTEASISTSANT